MDKELEIRVNMSLGRKSEAEWSLIEDLPVDYERNRLIVEKDLENYFKLYKYTPYGKELIIHHTTVTFERSIRYMKDKHKVIK
jgi:hypothetical protein